ncbi:MAG: CBS domain-containing protein [Gaiellaceae bacterium]
MSPRAAARLATLGFARVYDYVADKADWGSFNLPLDGRAGTETRAGAHLRRGVPTCRLTEPLRGVCERVEEAGWDTCFVVDETGIVAGRLGRSALRGEQDVSVEEAMTPGPSTIRPSARLSATVKRMREQDLANLPVTTSDGRLVGILEREDAERALSGLDNSQ